MIRFGRTACVALCAVITVAACVLISPAFARYSNSTSTDVVVGNPSAVAEQTMSADTMVYDFGICNQNADAEEFSHTLRILDDAPLSGFLKFSFDHDSLGDVAVLVDHAYYTQERDGGYLVSASDGDLQVPFSLMFSSVPTTDRVAVLDVSWYPNDGDEPTLFATYLVALAPSAEGAGDTTFLGGDTALLTPSTVAAQITVPADRTGVLLAQGDTLDATFTAGTRYFTKTYPQGVTLLRDSALYLTSTDMVLLNIPATDSVTLTAGVSETWKNSKTNLTPQAASLTASCDGTAVVSASQPLAVSLNADAADLTWHVHRYSGGVLTPVDLGTDLTVTASDHTLTVAAPTGKQPAGTYRLTVTRTYFGYPVEETTLWFFIDYR